MINISRTGSAPRDRGARAHTEAGEADAGDIYEEEIADSI